MRERHGQGRATPPQDLFNVAFVLCTDDTMADEKVDEMGRGGRLDFAGVQGVQELGDGEDLLISCPLLHRQHRVRQQSGEATKQAGQVVLLLTSNSPHSSLSPFGKVAS